MKRFKTVAIIGVGLIGGSIGIALRQRELAETVVGIGRSQTSLRAARRVGAVDRTTIDPTDGVADAELIIVCTPVGRIVDDVREAAKHCPEGALFTDVGSTKREIVAALDGGLARGCRFLGSHPLAGGEKTGATYAKADLFEGRVALLTPTTNTRAEDYDALATLWSSLGSVVIRMSPEEHDRALAATSHLPHLLASALAAVVPEEYFRLCGPGLLDTTRIAAGDPVLWRQIFSQNRDNLLACLDQYERQLQALRGAILQGDHSVTEELLAAAKRNRDALGS